MLPSARLSDLSARGTGTYGGVASGTSSDGSFLAYTYDGAHRLVRVGDAFDERIDYTLDAMGGRTLEQIHTAGGAAAGQDAIARVRRSRPPAAEHRRREPDDELRLRRRRQYRADHRPAVQRDRPILRRAQPPDPGGGAAVAHDRLRL